MKRVLTGIKPTGVPHLGNLLGAIQPAIELARRPDVESFLFIADYHSLTVRPDPARLNEEIYSVAAAWLACGLDPDRVVFYRQRDVPEIAQLAWVIGCSLPLGLLNRAHSFKQARQDGVAAEDVLFGLYSYPVLMAADILAFDIDVVPVGKDQKQHLEIAQEAARKFNLRYGEVLTVPAAQIDERVMTVPGTDGRKMSKSYDNTLSPFMPQKALEKRIKGIETDSTEFGQPLPTDDAALLPLIRLLASPDEARAIEAQYRSGRRDPGRPDADFEDPSRNYFGWGHAKKALISLFESRFREHRERYDHLMAHRGDIDALLERGAARAREVASGVLDRVHQASGLAPRP